MGLFKYSASNNQRVDFAELSSLLQEARGSGDIDPEDFFARLEKALGLSGIEPSDGEKIILESDTGHIVFGILTEYYNPELWGCQKDMRDDFKEIPQVIKCLDFRNYDGNRVSAGSIFANARAQLQIQRNKNQEAEADFALT